ncbi:hypothetical protein [Pseudoflavitalea rhizosphaerae]|uniref:hypothetical protein n=1 Tax=Pseudoflavitalea rhizosphaerae TaxID=1884793 RepID=UPI000F8F6579|nr:hypothetical protein [Pseudoflavitalea rhizosphaerae]
MISHTVPIPDTKRTDGVGIYFGQFSDNTKSIQQIQSYRRAMKLIEEQQYLDGVEAYFWYLKDEQLNNVVWQREEDQLSFLVYQGPVIVRGNVSGNILKAEVNIGSVEQPDIGLTDYLLAENHKNYYSRFSLNGNHIKMNIELDLNRQGISSLLYENLRELSLQSEKAFRHIQASFPQIIPTDTATDISIPHAEITVKYKYFRKWIEETLELSAEQDVTAESVLYRTLAYRLDFLLAPEGLLKKTINDIHWIYFTNDGSSEESRNQKMEQKFRQLLAKPENEITKSFCRTLYTFTQRRKPAANEVMDVLDELQEDISFYADSEPEVVKNLYQQAPLNIQYVCSMARPFTDLFVVYMQVMYSDYFRDLGLPAFRSDDGKIEALSVKKAIRSIEESWQATYPDFRFNKDEIIYDSPGSFYPSFIYQLASQQFVF